MRAPDLLRLAMDVLAERGEQRDRPEGERSMAAAVAAFNAVSGHNLSTKEGWRFMMCLKMARGNAADDDLDLIGYAALAAEEGVNERRDNA
jgi:hypothetical protein